MLDLNYFFLRARKTLKKGIIIFKLRIQFECSQHQFQVHKDITWWSEKTFLKISIGILGSSYAFKYTCLKAEIFYKS